MRPISDAFTAHFFQRLNPAVREQLSPGQIDAISEALRVIGPREHAIDLRWTLNLIFKRYYFVFLAGRDTRREQVDTARNARRDTAKTVRSMLVLLAFLLPALVALIVLLYGVKCLLGINIFETKHFADFLPWGGVAP